MSEPTIDLLTDEELAERSRNGDTEALEVLVRTYLPKTHRKVRSLVPESDAEDVRQEIFLSLIKSLPNFRVRSNFAAWFGKITMGRIADYYRQRSRRRDDPTEELPSEIYDPWRKVNYKLTVEGALQGIPETYAGVLLLAFTEGLSLVEISGELHLTYEATRSRYRRGVNMLKEKLTGAPKGQFIFRSEQ